MKSALHTSDPLALQYLMSETLFSIEDDVANVHYDAGGETNVKGEADEMTVEPAMSQATVKQSPSFVFIGENKRQYLFVTDDAQSDYMSEAGMDAFLKTIAARKMELADVALVNLARHQGQVTFAELSAFFKPRAVVLLGPSATRFGLLEMQANSVGKISDIEVFQTYSFDVLLDDLEKKSAFWNLLKSILI